MLFRSFAIVGAPRASLERRAAAGHRGAAVVAGVLRDPRQQDRYIATAQLGITIASLGLGMFGEHGMADWLAPRLHWLGEHRMMTAHGIASVLAVALLTCLHIVVGEMLPKSLALQHTEASARWLYWPMRLSWYLAFPFVWTFQAVSEGALWLMGVRAEHGDEQLHTPEELRLIVEESEEGGALRAESGRLLQELFEFGDLTATQVMTPRVRVTGIPQIGRAHV